MVNVDIKVPHQLSIDQAKDRVRSWVADLRSNPEQPFINFKEIWREHSLTFCFTSRGIMPRFNSSVVTTIYFVEKAIVGSCSVDGPGYADKLKKTINEVLAKRLA